MKGVLIPGTSIIIDSEEHDPNNNYTHFLSHIHLESNCNFKAMRNYQIFTSEFNKWFLVEFHNFDPNNIDCLGINDKMTIVDKDTGVVTKVKAIDSNYCSGSVMFLFEGDTGNFLYAGNFRFFEKLLDVPPLNKYLSRGNILNFLYIDLQWPLSKYPLFPSKHEVLLDVLEFVRYSYDLCIFVAPHFGNKELGVAVSLELQEPVYVNSDRLKVLKHLQLGDYFTDDSKQSRVWMLNASELKDISLSSIDVPYKIVSLYINQNFDFLGDVKNSIFYFPYQAHSSRDELVFFISAIRPFGVILLNSNLGTKSGSSYAVPPSSSCLINFMENDSESFTVPLFKRMRTELEHTSAEHLCRNFSKNHKNPNHTVVRPSNKVIKNSHSNLHSAFENNSRTGLNYKDTQPIVSHEQTKKLDIILSECSNQVSNNYHESLKIMYSEHTSACPCKTSECLRVDSNDSYEKFKARYPKCTSTGSDKSEIALEAKTAADGRKSDESDDTSFWSDLTGYDVLELHHSQYHPNFQMEKTPK